MLSEFSPFNPEETKIEHPQPAKQPEPHGFQETAEASAKVVEEDDFLLTEEDYHDIEIAKQKKAGGEPLTRQEELILKLDRRAHRDELTGLGNRALLNREIQVERRHEKPGVALLVLDIDNFKTINDTRGHEAGDEVLRSIGAFLNLHVRGQDRAFRYGGDEFIIFAGNMGNDQDIEAIKHRLTAEIAQTTGVRVSMGSIDITKLGSSVGERHISFGELLHEADREMYRDKRSRKAQTDASRLSGEPIAHRPGQEKPPDEPTPPPIDTLENMGG